jgi:hypothetical protein
MPNETFHIIVIVSDFKAQTLSKCINRFSSINLGDVRLWVVIFLEWSAWLLANMPNETFHIVVIVTRFGA